MLPPCYATSFWNIIYYHDLHLPRGTASYQIKLKSLYILTRNVLIDITISIIDICYTNMAPIPKTVMFFKFINEKNHKNARQTRPH